MICSRCLREFKEDDDEARIDAEGILTCGECFAEENAYHEAEWLSSREPWAEDGCPDPSKDCGCMDCAARRMDAAEHRYEQEQGK